MSPLLQKPRPPQSPEPSTSSNQPTSSRSPQSWFRPANNPSLSSLTKSQHPHRALGFSSIKGLARSSSRQTLRTLPTTTYQKPYSHGCSPPKHGSLKNPNAAKDPESSLPSESGLQQSRNSSLESLPIDKSGISSDSTYATTPSPAKHRAFQLLESSSPVQRKSMGNKASTLRRKSVPPEGKQSSAAFDVDLEKATGPSNQQTSTGSQKPATFSAHRSSIIVNVPRRRSSLTVLHLDSSHFETPDPQHRNLQHRASTLTEPRRRPSVHSETIRPVTTIVTASSDTTPPTQAQKRETLSPGFLSPPLLSPPLSTSQPSSASSQALSFKSQSSAVPTSIHLPKTFPDGAIPVPAPKLSVTHFKCFQSHRRVLPSRNKHNPVPCMTCGETEGEARWKCVWCALRICGACMAEFDAKHRDLERFLAERKQGGKEGGGKEDRGKEDRGKEDRGKEDRGKEGGAKDEVQELDGGREQVESKKDNVASQRESQKLGTATMKKLLRASH